MFEGIEQKEDGETKVGTETRANNDLSPVKEFKDEDDQSPDKLLHRLPQNYFMEDDDDSEEIEAVTRNIQNMREQMLEYVKEEKMDK